MLYFFYFDLFYSKIDIEWGEFQTGGFSDWFSSGALQNVHQLGIIRIGISHRLLSLGFVSAIELHLPRNTVSG